MIAVTRTTKIFGRKTAVKEISFTAKGGEIIGFLGPNGAGKTTTMRLIVGYLRPTSGTIEVNGHEPGEERMSTLQHIGYLPENNPLYTDMRVGEYIDFIAGIKKKPLEPSLWIELGLEDVRETKIEELSRGYKQRVGLAAALCGNPDILLLDEPTSGLDPIEQDKIKDLIKKMSAKRTIIFSTHILSEVEDIAGRIIIINGGQIIYNGIKPKGKGAVEKLFKRIVK
jgi:ABC-2 type transport system ATP-binding protein